MLTLLGYIIERIPEGVNKLVSPFIGANRRASETNHVKKSHELLIYGERKQ